MAINNVVNILQDGAMGNRAIWQARRAARLTLTQLSTATGISHSQLSRFESGKREPRMTDLAKIAETLSVPVETLFPGQQPAADPSFVIIPPANRHDMGAVAHAVHEAFIALGANEAAATELVGMIQQVILARLPSFPDLTAEETTRWIVRERAIRILAKHKGLTQDDDQPGE